MSQHLFAFKVLLQREAEAIKKMSDEVKAKHRLAATPEVRYMRVAYAVAWRGAGTMAITTSRFTHTTGRRTRIRRRHDGVESSQGRGQCQ